MRWGFALDDGLDVAVARVQAAEQVEHLTGLGDGVPNVAQVVGEALELGAVLVDAQVALLNAAELDFVEDSALKFVVAEQGFDVPQRVKAEVWGLWTMSKTGFLIVV
jgi:hypothetical protein